MPVLKALPALLASAVAVAALGGLDIVNSCDIEVRYWESNNGGRDIGPTIIKPGATSHVDFVVNPSGGSSIKIGKDNRVEDGVLQFEYTVIDEATSASMAGLFWDASDLDGKGNNAVGTPFRADNVRISPSGKGFGSNTCQVLTCVADEVCAGSYQLPDDQATRFCPLSSGVMQLALCADLGEDGKQSADSKKEPPVDVGDAIPAKIHEDIKDKVDTKNNDDGKAGGDADDKAQPAAPIAFEIKASSTMGSSPTPVGPPPPPVTPSPTVVPPPPVIVVTVTDYVTAWVDPMKRGLPEYREAQEKRDVAHVLKHARGGFAKHAKKGAHFHA